MTMRRYDDKAAYRRALHPGRHSVIPMLKDLGCTQFHQVMAQSYSQSMTGMAVTIPTLAQGYHTTEHDHSPTRHFNQLRKHQADAQWIQLPEAECDQD